MIAADHGPTMKENFNNFFSKTGLENRPQKQPRGGHCYDYKNIFAEKLRFWVKLQLFRQKKLNILLFFRKTPFL
jgi:hypothetical protein